MPLVGTVMALLRNRFAHEAGVYALLQAYPLRADRIKLRFTKLTMDKIILSSLVN